MAEERTEGWQDEARIGQRVFHYIDATFSLCRKLGFYRGALQEAKPGAPKRKDDCAACYKLLQRRAK